MKFRVWILIAVTTIFLPSLANALCAAFYPTVADGRMYNNVYAAAGSTTIAVYATVTAGHSYSVEIANPFESLGGPGPGVVNFYINLLVSGDCVAADSGGTITDTTAADPALYTAGGHRRASFATLTTEFVYAVINNTDSVGHSYRVQITDTTLYNPRWSTNQGYITVYGFQNTTTQTIHGTLFLNYTFGGTGPARYSLNGSAGIAPGAQLLVALGSGLTINVPAGEGGTATLAHDGPPGGLTVDAYFANSVSLVPAVFAPRNAQH